MPQNNDVLTFEDVQLVFRNFAGRARPPYDPPGSRSFNVIITDHAIAEQMIADNFNVKQFNEREGDEEGTPRDYYTKVKVNYDGIRPPRIVLVTDRGRTTLEQSQVEMLDAAEIKTVDFTANVREWDKDGVPHYTLYLRTMYVTIVEDPLDAKYMQMDAEPPAA